MQVVVVVVVVIVKGNNEHWLDKQTTTTITGSAAVAETEVYSRIRALVLRASLLLFARCNPVLPRCCISRCFSL